MINTLNQIAFNEKNYFKRYLKFEFATIGELHNKNYQSSTIKIVHNNLTIF